MRESPFNHLDLTSSVLTFPRILTHNFHTSLFAGRTTEQVERRAEPMSVLVSPTFPPQRHRAPTYIQIIPLQGKLCAIPRHFVLPCSAGVIFPLCFAKCTHLVLPYIFRDGIWRLGRPSHPKTSSLRRYWWTTNEVNLGTRVLLTLPLSLSFSSSRGLPWLRLTSMPGCSTTTYIPKLRGRRNFQMVFGGY